MNSIIDTNCAVLDFLGISRKAIQVDIAIRLQQLPVVTIVRYVEPQEILGVGDDRHLKTETVRFTLTRIEEDPSGPQDHA